MKQRLSVLGSTGSIGVQTLDIVRENPDMFEVTSLTAHRNWQLLARQAVEFDADTVVIGDKECYEDLASALSGTQIKVFAGNDSIAAAASFCERCRFTLACSRRLPRPFTIIIHLQSLFYS